MIVAAGGWHKTVEGSSGEKRSFGDVDSAVEYINQRPHENFTIYNATQVIIEEIRRRVRATIKQG
jgi:hypothetical protein